jgi:hypothetical protein
MSNEINFKLELKGNGSIKKLILNHDSGQGADEILVSMGNEAIVVNPWELFNLCRRAFELLTTDTYEQQVCLRMPVGYGRDVPGVVYDPVLQRVQPAPKVKYDRDDK